MLKNGWPWSALVNTKITVPDDYIRRVKEFFANTKWEELKRLPQFKAIYPDTRVIHCDIDSLEDPNPSLVKMFTIEALQYIQPAFPEFKMFHSEFVYMVPNGYVEWHHDVRKFHHYGSKVMLLIENEDVEYHFSEWADNVPRLQPVFEQKDYLKEPFMAKMKVGNFYVFNHRIPHMTKNPTNRPRYMIFFEFIPNWFKLENRMETCCVTASEMKPLSAPIE